MDTTAGDRGLRMNPDRIVRIYVSVLTSALPAGGTAEAAVGYLRRVLRERGHGTIPDLPPDIENVSGRIRPPKEFPRELVERRTVLALHLPLAVAERTISILSQQPGIRAGLDLPIATNAWWCPGQGPPHFGDRVGAERLIRAETLRACACEEPVNLVIIDQGLPADIPYDGPRRGWTVTDAGGQVREPFQGTGGHAAMVARNARAFTDKDNVILWDCPLLPERIDSLPVYLSYAEVVFGQIVASIRQYRKDHPGEGSFVLVNAWGVWDTSQDALPGSPANYARNPAHPLSRLVARLDRRQVDQVYAAGNCGQFCPPTRCGPRDRGPGRSILGVNSHPRVLTVGAVRADGLWVGYSAEGPGTLSDRKPDLCAPSLFRDRLGPGLGGDNSGTSAACGVAAGVIAAARACRPWNRLSPARLRRRLRQGARFQGEDPAARSRFGAGILDAEAVAGLCPPLPEDEPALPAA
ncbi:S8 family serine peptidase [Roseicella aquatilis]|uniref:Peptidase S8/S53 domain-containing protein n=1 Tax=Roseicella aquatilis TaxID=2527868 RepID=A0A4R4D4B3_9PROT|nr:S8 family serine peptidase [Roseicella aquatilis]TCZ54627.1 hypothetical protein EXY23_22825 [Roseicella aquatilis]